MGEYAIGTIMFFCSSLFSPPPAGWLAMNGSCVLDAKLEEVVRGSPMDGGVCGPGMVHLQPPRGPSQCPGRLTSDYIIYVGKKLD